MRSAVPAPAPEVPDSGMSLIEVLLVLGIIAAAYAIAMPNVRGASKSTELRVLANDLTSHLRATRASAIARGRPVGIMFDIAGPSYTTESNGRTIALPRDIGVSVTTAREIARQGAMARMLFFPDGSASGGNIVFSRSQQRLVVGVEWLTGLARIEAGE